MESEQNQTHVRAEIGWYWEREKDGVRQTDSGSLLHNVYKKDIDENRLDGVWNEIGLTLDADQTTSIALDYLTRKTVGGTLDVGFLDVRALLVVNHGPGKLVIQPGLSCGWQEPWESGFGVNVVPPKGAILLSAGDAPWKVTILSGTLKFEAQDDKCLYDVAIIGKIGDVQSSESSGSSDASSSSDSSSSSGSSESISE